MKTMKLFSMAALALAMAACSNNDDNEIQQNTQQPGTMHFTATIAAPSGDATTRTVYTEEGTTINVKWKVGDKIALVHNGVVDEAEVKTVDDVTGKATIEADFTGSPSDDDDVTLAYPADAVVSATPYKTFTFTPNPVIFDKVKNSQNGTLAYIQNNLDLRVGSGKLAVSGSDVSLKESVSIPSLICIWKLTLQDESSNALSATQLTFKNYTYTQAKATSTAKSVYYLCVVPSFIPDDEGTFSFEATVGGDTYTFSKTGLSLTAGKYYQSTVTMAKAPARTLAEATAEDIGKVAGADGKIYSNVAVAKAAGTTACAIIAYVGSATGESQNHGLAIAMKDAAAGSSVKWSSSYNDELLTNFTTVNQAVTTAQSGLSNSQTSGFNNVSNYPAFYAALNNTITTSDGISAAAPASGTSGWFLPSLYQWNMIVKGLSGKTANLAIGENDDYKASSLNTKIEAVGGTGLRSSGYWSSTELNGNNVCIFLANSGNVYFYDKGNVLYVRSAFAF